MTYKPNYMLCEKFYMGKTSQFVKDCFQAHYNLVQAHSNQKLGSKKDLTPSSTLVSHLVQHLWTVHNTTSTTIEASNVQGLL